MKSPSLAFVASVAIVVFSGCEVMNELSGYVTSSEFTYYSSAIEGGGANAGKDYVTGLVPNDESRSYFTKASVTESKKVVVSPGNDQGTGVEWTDDGGILIPPGVTIEFTNNGHCMDPHLPAPKSGEEMQFVKMSSLLPKKLQGTYKALQQRAAAGDEDVSANMQRLVWALRTSSSDDAMAKYLSEQQMEILQDCAASSVDFSDFSLDSIMKGLVTDVKTIAANTIAQATAVRIGNVTYNAFDLMDPDKCLEKVDAHAQALVDMSKNMPVSKTGFNYGQLASGIYTDVKGGRSDAPASGFGWLTFNAKIANATSQPYVFYPNDYAAQVGSGDTSSEGVYYATSSTTMRQRITIGNIDSVITQKNNLIGSPNEGRKISNKKGSGGYPQIISDASHKVATLQKAVDVFEDKLRNSDFDYKDGEQEAYAVVYKENGNLYMTDIRGGDLVSNSNIQSATLKIGVDWQGASWSRLQNVEIVSVIHSHPQGKDSGCFSMADQAFVIKGWTEESSNGESKTWYPSLILINTGNESGWFNKTYERRILEHGFIPDKDDIYKNKGRSLYGLW